MTEVVRRQVVVTAPIEQAFTVFTARFGDFKPKSTTCSTRRSPKPSSSPRSAGTSMTGPSTAPSAAGPVATRVRHSADLLVIPMLLSEVNVIGTVRKRDRRQTGRSPAIDRQPVRWPGGFSGRHPGRL